MTDSNREHADQANDAQDAEQAADGKREHGGSGSSRERSESWSHAQEAFERLSVEEKAFFLVESTFDTMLKGLREAGDAVKNAMDEALSDLEKKKQEARRRAERKEDASGEKAAGAAKEESEKQGGEAAGS